MPRVAKPKTDGAKKPAPKKKNGYVMPEPIPLGEVLTDLAKKQWRVGPSIGSGGFGEIYSACKNEENKKPDDYEYVVKIEPHGNGPLFVEIHFYLRNAKFDDIKNFMKNRRLKALGMPYLVGNGSHELNGQKHRFIIMPRYGRDVWSFFLENGKKLPLHTIYRIAAQMMDVYDYIHSCSYVHGDLKGANILLGFGKGGGGQTYLVDYGLAAHYTTGEFKPDPKKMHNGTIEYTSRDAHQGVATMRGDLEILGYNLIHWSGVTLPWEKEKLLAAPAKVQKSKENFMANLDANLNDFYSNSVPTPIRDFMQYVAAMDHNDTPDYSKCKNWFLKGLKNLGKSNTGDLDFKLQTSAKVKSKAAVSPKKQVKSTAKSPVVSTSTEDDVFETKRPPKPSARRVVESPKDRKKTESVSTPKDTPNKRKNIPSSDSPASSTRSRRNTPISANVNFSPVVKINRITPASKKPGSTIINDLLTPTLKAKKTYEVNFELDVSMDANVIVNVKRKKRAKDDVKSSTESDRSESTPVHQVKVRKVAAEASDSPQSGATSSSKRAK